MDENSLTDQVNAGTFGRVIRVIVILLIGFAIISLAVFNSKKNLSDSIWKSEATVGSVDAKNYFIQYSDLACPYCNIFSKNIHDNYDEFKSEWIEGKDILFEVRLTAFLHEYGEHKPDSSLWSAEAAYCAADEGKFFDYYYTAIDTLYEDYYSKGIGVSKTAPKIEGKGAEQDYWLEIGKKIGLGEQFTNCFHNEDKREEILSYTNKAANLVGGGLPYFKFNSWTTNGYDQSWGWEYVEQYFESGLKSKK